MGERKKLHEMARLCTYPAPYIGIVIVMIYYMVYIIII